jgi:hypothetical protein
LLESFVLVARYIIVKGKKRYGVSNTVIITADKRNEANKGPTLVATFIRTAPRR